MSAKRSFICKLSLVAVFGMVLISSVLIHGQTAWTRRPVGVPDDWTHHHLVFSNPGTAAEALGHGRFEQWYRIVNDPRYIMQENKRHHMPLPPPEKQPMHRDWSMYMGPGLDASATGTIASEPNSGSTITITNINTSTSLVLTAAATAVACPATGEPRTGSFVRSATAATDAANLVAQINSSNCGSYVGVSATNPGAPSASVTIIATTGGIAGDSIFLLTSSAGATNFQIAAWAISIPLVGGGAGVLPGNYPVKYSFLTTSANCASAATPDFVAFPTGISGSGTQASIIAYDNLYSGCTGSVPLIYWQYNTGTLTTTSPVLSSDGTQVAYMESGAPASLVLLKWAKNSSLVTLTSTAAASYHGCTAPCMTAIPFAASTANDLVSSPFYDYTNDIIYVGDGLGIMHKFTNVFISGTPTEVTTGGWPAVFSSSAAMGSPVYDAVSGNVFAGAVGLSTGGNYHRIPAAGGTVVTVTGLADPLGTGFGNGPLVDPVAQSLYVFVNADHADTNGRVYQLSTSFAAGAGPTGTPIGQGDIAGTVYVGALDNIYYTSSNGASPTGNLYVCAEAPATELPTLWQVPITNNVMATTANVGPALSTTGISNCSSVTEFLNGSTDSIFVSATAGNLTVSPISCPSGNGCIMSFNVTSASGWGTGKTTSATLGVTGGASGVIIDNSSSMTGASQVYFTPLNTQTCVGNGSTGSGTGGCAVQASQAGLN